MTKSGSDIVTRLREFSLPGQLDYPDWYPDITQEAADEIDRLSAALAPFAEIGKRLKCGPDDSMWIEEGDGLKASHFYAAAKTLDELEK